MEYGILFAADVNGDLSLAFSELMFKEVSLKYMIVIVSMNIKNGIFW